MRPELFYLEVLGRTWAPSSYAVLYVVAFLAAGALVLAPRERRRELLPHLHEIALVLVIGGWLVARLAKPVVYAGTGAPTSGTFFFGWAAGSTGLLWVWARLRGLRPARLFDAIAPGVLLGSAIGRVGCLLGGCCRGIACDPPWGVELAGHPGTWFPAQLANAAGDLLALALLLAVVKPRLRREGELTIRALWLYVAFRFPIEWLRSEPVVLLGMTQGQVIGFALGGLGLLIWKARSAQAARAIP